MRLITVLTVLLAAVTTFAAERPSASHEVYFEGTNYELHVYTVNGRRDGNTMLMLGGIQGDEPGGYLSADLYARLKLEQGNLIVIPRVNLKSVILFNRGADGDMNRLFTNAIANSDTEKVVQIIIRYMKQADILLNLHDGWGFHSDTYISSQRNPNRFGQSIIVDEDVFLCSDNNSIELKDMAQNVLAVVNSKISDENHMLAYFNTRTGSPDTSFKNMQKTATWYALKNFCIPAFGIESSKNIASVELKVLYHNYAINEFMRMMEIIPEHPPIFTHPAALEYALVTINGNSVMLRDGDSVTVQKNDKISVNHIEANYNRGVSCDVLGYGNLNDLNKEVGIGFSTKIVFRKEDEKFAEISVVVAEQATTAQPVQIDTPHMIFMELNGTLNSYAAGKTIQIENGDTIRLIRIEKDGKDLNLPLNLRGWVPSGVSSNTGDDRKHIFTARAGGMLSRFSVDGKGKLYPITVNNENGKEIARIYLEFR